MDMNLVDLTVYKLKWCTYIDNEILGFSDVEITILEWFYNYTEINNIQSNLVIPVKFYFLIIVPILLKYSDNTVKCLFF